MTLSRLRFTYLPARRINGVLVHAEVCSAGDLYYSISIVSGLTRLIVTGQDDEVVLDVEDIDYDAVVSAANAYARTAS